MPAGEQANAAARNAQANFTAEAQRREELYVFVLLAFIGCQRKGEQPLKASRTKTYNSSLLCILCASAVKFAWSIVRKQHSPVRRRHWPSNREPQAYRRGGFPIHCFSVAPAAWNAFPCSGIMTAGAAPLRSLWLLRSCAAARAPRGAGRWKQPAPLVWLRSVFDRFRTHGRGRKRPRNRIFRQRASKMTKFMDGHFSFFRRGLARNVQARRNAWKRKIYCVSQMVSGWPNTMPSRTRVG